MIGKVATCFALALLCWPAPAASQIERIQFTTENLVDLDARMKRSTGHPNELWRLRALKSHRRGDDAEAARYFAQAAEYADKYSQHALSLMHWHGMGVPQDRVEAYIWSDLAAERGNRRLLLIREKMWSELDAAQRAQVESRGPDFYRLYGDDVAKPRTNREIWSASTEATGSRTGFQHKLAIMPGGLPFRPSPAQVGAQVASAGLINDEVLYGRDRVEPDRYWRIEDHRLETSVSVGALQQVEQAGNTP